MTEKLLKATLNPNKQQLYANSVDHDQMPRSAASDLGLHCLPMSQKWDARLIWVNTVKDCIQEKDSWKILWLNELDE